MNFVQMNEILIFDESESTLDLGIALSTSMRQQILIHRDYKRQILNGRELFNSGLGKSTRVDPN